MLRSKIKRISIIMSVLYVATLLSVINVLQVEAASKFDTIYYALTYPDVLAVFGTDQQMLLNHYLEHGINEGRLPYEGAEAGVAVSGIADPSETFDPEYYATAYTDVAAVFGTNRQALLNHYLEYGIYEGRLPYAGAVSNTASGNTTGGLADTGNTFIPVPMSQLANLSSLQKKASNEELAQAYAIAVELVAPYANLSIEEQLYGIAASLRQLFNNGMTYSMSAPHYNDPYGYFVLGTASCAGCTRATGLCLNILGISYEHVNENQYSHQWCRINVNGVYWICDAYGLYCGQEPAPYEHPYLK